MPSSPSSGIFSKPILAFSISGVSIVAALSCVVAVDAAIVERETSSDAPADGPLNAETLVVNVPAAVNSRVIVDNENFIFRYKEIACLG